MMNHQDCESDWETTSESETEYNDDSFDQTFISQDPEINKIYKGFPMKVKRALHNVHHDKFLDRADCFTCGCNHPFYKSDLLHGEFPCKIIMEISGHCVKSMYVPLIDHFIKSEPFRRWLYAKHKQPYDEESVTLLLKQ
jgi:hypothetical protein